MICWGGGREELGGWVHNNTIIENYLNVHVGADLQQSLDNLLVTPDDRQVEGGSLLPVNPVHIAPLVHYKDYFNRNRNIKLGICHIGPTTNALHYCTNKKVKLLFPTEIK